jgi:hypothetical protein
MPNYTPAKLTEVTDRLRARLQRRRELGYRLTEIPCDELERLLDRVAPRPAETATPNMGVRFGARASR